MTTASLFLVAAALGATLRYAFQVGMTDVGPLPVGTLLVNLAGSFALGVLAAWDPPGATVVGTAGIGALTTFSTFSAQLVWLRDDGWTAVVTYLAASVIGGVAIAWLGLHVA